MAAASCITQTGAFNTCPSGIPSAWRKPASSRLWGVSVPLTTTPETIDGLYKAEIIHRRGPWRSFEAVELVTLEWVDWFNHRR